LADNCHFGCFIPRWHVFPALCRGDLFLGTMFVTAIICQLEVKSAEIRKKMRVFIADLRFF
jgi:hypothetical protein